MKSRIVLAFLAPVATFALTTHHHSKRDLTPATDLPASWTYSGCYVDSVSARALKSASYVDASGLTGASCVDFCRSKGYPIAGTEYSTECYCGISLPAQAASDPSTCNKPCSGDATQACGGPNRLSVYTAPANSQPGVNPGPTGWKSLGCYTDSVSARTLSRNAGQLGGSAGLTVGLCAQACSGSAYFGVEYAGECYCGNSILNGAASATDGCNQPCKGNSSEFCGGSNRLNLYQSTVTPPTPPVSTCSTGRPYTLCCMGFAPWYTNSGVWGGICGYNPSNPNQLVGARCIDRPASGCPSGLQDLYCAGRFGGGQCGLGTDCCAR
ncbi:WSC-domain-containing protein [Polyplosphaeria fusca]|uniref:WSC-domain-containing protein n=1 Tax=Polyplosphaeria fusca TaxID=682080 RepID=A0A9P4R5C0_9PLEO|nr:WSC-domain-containing protein [Polyplosphaeria fusca]